MQGGHWRAGAICIGLEENGEIVAGVMFDWFNGASIFASIAAKKMTRRFLWVCCDYAFRQLGANAMIALVSPENYQSQKACKRIGFKQAASIQKAHPDGDQLIYAMYKDDCKWLRKAHEQTKCAATT